jgi:septum formation protein
MQKLILASQSPRRQEILTLAGIDFTVHPATDEKAPGGLAPAEYALALAKQK